MTTTTQSLATSVDRFLDALAAGAPVADVLAQDAVLDATVPNWRFRQRGRSAVLGQLTQWFADPGRYEELRRQPTGSGEVVEYTLLWEEAGVPFSAHHVHVLTVNADGLIASDHFWCGGRWPAGHMAEMDEAQRALDARNAQ